MRPDPAQRAPVPIFSGVIAMSKLELVRASAHPRAKKSMTWLGALIKDFERLETLAAQERVANSFQDTRALLVGFSNGNLLDIRDKLRSVGLAATSSMSDIRRIGDISELRSEFGLVIVNFDAFPDMDEAIDAMLQLRADTPELSVVAVSEMVNGDDFGNERAPICDVTLKLPVSKTRLAQGLVMAQQNRHETFSKH